MLIAYWIFAGLVALVSLYAGIMKLFRSREQLAVSGMAWTAGFSPVSIKLIAVVELIGVVGLIGPPLTGIAPILGPIAAIGIGVLQIGAAVTHSRIGEKPFINIVLIVLAAAAAVFGFLVWG